MVIDFFVRIFIYGLTGFVQSDGQTTVLLPTAVDHEAFVAFANGTCSPPPCGKIGALQGFKLAGDQIDIPQLVTPSPSQGHQRQPRLAMVSHLPTGFITDLPFFVLDGAAFDWVTPIAQIVQDPTVDPDCLTGTSSKTCNHAAGGLQGRLVLTSGMLSTCRLIETSVNPPCSGEVHSFTFPQTSAQQALAEIEVDVTKLTASGLTLTLSHLGGQPWETVTFTPTPGTCIGGDRKAACVDVFVGNMPTKKIPGDCSVQKKGEHFAALYGLLANAPSTQPLPLQDLGNSVLASSVQPACQDVPSGPDATTMDQFQALTEVPHLRQLTPEFREREGTFEKYVRSVLRYPNQRPICPMATFNSPPPP